MSAQETPTPYEFLFVRLELLAWYQHSCNLLNEFANLLVNVGLASCLVLNKLLSVYKERYVHSQLLLQQIADSAFPIGGQAHSFGLETLVGEGLVTPANLAAFLEDYLIESATLDGWVCRQAYQLAVVADEMRFVEEWRCLNQRLSALRTARESRAASAALGRRFLGLLQNLSPHPRLTLAYQFSRNANEELHYASAFGLTGGVLELGEDETVLAFLQQGIGSLLAATQKMMSIGQTQTVTILWQLKPALIATAQRSRCWSWNHDLSATGTLLELASMRHATLPVRLFIS